MGRTTRVLAHPDMPDPAILTKIAARLRQELGAERIIVYGSVARGEATIHSDIDLFVIAPSTEKGYERIARVHEVTRDLGIGLPIAPLVLTPDEVRCRVERGDPFVRDLLEMGVEL